MRVVIEYPEKMKWNTLHTDRYKWSDNTLREDISKIEYIRRDTA